MKDRILTGIRPTGNLHIGHYAGAILNILNLQNNLEYDKFFLMIADTQALTDNAKNVDKVKNSILQVAIDCLSTGIDPNKITIFIQSQVPELFEMTAYFMNLVTISRLKRNPTIKDEIKQRGFETNIPVGFFTYPISQTSDIVAFDTTLVPVGEDQLPMIEQTREIVNSFNNTYEKVLTLPKPLIPENKACIRLPGTDGKLKMSKSAGNCIYLCDDEATVKQKIMSAYTDPSHIKATDPGHIEGNVVFSYLDAFCKDEHFAKYMPEYKNLDELKQHYTRGGLGDVKIKLLLNNVIQEILTPFREKRKELEQNINKIYELLFNNASIARAEAQKVLKKMHEAMGINYEKYLNN